MTDNSHHGSHQERYGKTEKKTLTLTHDAIDAIQAYADQHALYFSVAIESLALMGLGQTTAETLPRLVATLLERALNRQFNRFAKLLSLTAIAAEEINYKVEVLLLQTIWAAAQLDPDNFVEQMLVSTDPADQPAALARQTRDDICADAHEEAVARLKKPLGESGTLWEQEATGAA